MQDFLNAYRQYAQFEGRTGRKGFWYFILFYVVACGVLAIADTVIFGAGGLQPLSGIFGLISLVPSIAIAVRRLHDTNRSGWFVLIGLIPLVGIILLIIWYCQKSDEAANKFGEPAPVVPAID